MNDEKHRVNELLPRTMGENERSTIRPSSNDGLSDRQM